MTCILFHKTSNDLYFEKYGLYFMTFKKNYVLLPLQEELVAHPQSSRDGIAAVVGLMEKASEPGIYIPWHSRSLSDRF